MKEIRNNQKYHYEFSPKPDITIGELANLIRLLCISVDEKMFHAMSPGISRHFIKECKNETGK